MPSPAPIAKGALKAAAATGWWEVNTNAAIVTAFQTPEKLPIFSSPFFSYWRFGTKSQKVSICTKDIAALVRGHRLLRWWANCWINNSSLNGT